MGMLEKKMITPNPLINPEAHLPSARVYMSYSLHSVKLVYVGQSLFVGIRKAELVKP